MAKTGKEKKPKKAVKTAPSEEQARKAEEFAGLIADLVLEAMPERVDPSTRKRWKSLAGRAVLRKEFERIFANLHLSIDEMEEMLYRPAKKSILEYAPEERTADIFPQIPVLPDLVLEDGQEAVAEGRFKSEEEQRSFLDAGPADEHWSGEKQKSDAGRQLMPGLISNSQEDVCPPDLSLEIQEAKQAVEAEILPTDPFADLMKEWEEFYHDVFKEEIGEGTVSVGDLQEVKCPVRISGLLQLVVVARGITPLVLYKKCMRYFPCYSRRIEDYNFVWLISSERNANNRSYSVWTDRRLNSDKELVGISPARLRANEIPVMTFEERCLHDLFRFYQDAKDKGVNLGEYDMKNFARVAGVGFQYDEATLCVGSKVNDPQKKKGNTVLYMWVDRKFAIKIWEPKDWPIGVDEREAEKRYLQNMRAHMVSVETEER